MFSSLFLLLPSACCYQAHVSLFSVSGVSTLEMQLLLTCRVGVWLHLVRPPADSKALRQLKRLVSKHLVVEAPNMSRKFIKDFIRGKWADPQAWDVIYHVLEGVSREMHAYMQGPSAAVSAPNIVLSSDVLQHRDLEALSQSTFGTLATPSSLGGVTYQSAVSSQVTTQLASSQAEEEETFDWTQLVSSSSDGSA